MVAEGPTSSFDRRVVVEVELVKPSRVVAAQAPPQPVNALGAETERP